MSAIGDYLRETRTELRHVAWPTRTQTIVYTVLVAAISVGIAAYLGLFDYIFTGALTHVFGVQSNQVQVTSVPVSTSTSAAGAPTFNLGTSTQQ